MPILGQWSIGRTQTGHLYHAVRSEGILGAPEGSVLATAWGTRTACGAGGSQITSNSDVPYSPNYHDTDYMCRDCQIIWTAHLAPDVGGWDRVCRTCAETKAVNHFPSDLRTKDGMSKDCVSCLWKKRKR